MVAQTSGVADPAAGYTIVPLGTGAPAEATEAPAETESRGNPCDIPSQHYVIVTLFVLGSFGNLLAFVVMRRPAFARRDYSSALSLLCFFNALTLFTQALNSADTLAYKRFNTSFENYIGALGCKLHRLVPVVVQLMDHWIVVFITAQRFVTVHAHGSNLAARLSRLLHNRYSRVIFPAMFGVVLATQAWRPVMDTQENNECTADPLHLYIEVDLFQYQLALLTLSPAIIILVMNLGVLVHLYRQVARRRRDSLTKGRSHQDAIDRRVRKTSITLLAVTGTFWLYIMPKLGLLLYVCLNELIDGREAGFYAFLDTCQALAVADILATFSCADYFVIQYVFDDLFRVELKFMVLRLLGNCSSSFRFRYIQARRQHRLQVAAGEFEDDASELPPPIGSSDSPSPSPSGSSASSQSRPFVSPHVVRFIDTDSSGSMVSSQLGAFEQPPGRVAALLEGRYGGLGNSYASSLFQSTLTSVSRSSADVPRYPSRLILFMYMQEAASSSADTSASSLFAS